jgi:SOS-response transcriptional repressor LexA
MTSSTDIHVAESFGAPVDVSRRSFFLRVPGESMFDATSPLSFREGELVLVDVDIKPKHGAVVLIRMPSGDFLLRQLIDEGSRSFVKALNPAWPDRITPLDLNSLLFGTVVAKMTIF